MARERYLIGVSEDELQPDPKPEEPKGFRGKLSNFWYHYKWPVIVGAVAAVLVTIFVCQIVFRDDPDYFVVLATQNALEPGVAEALTAELQKYGRDVDEDGKVEVLVESLTVGGGSSMSAAGASKLMSHFSTGDAMIFLFDKTTYETNVKPNTSEDFDFYAKLEVPVSGLEDDGRYWNWKDDPLRQQDILKTAPEDLYFGVREATGSADKEKSRQMYETGLELMRAFLTKTPLVSEPSGTKVP